MEQNNGKTIAIIGIMAAVVIGLGVWVWSMNNDNTTTTSTQDTNTQMTEESSPAKSQNIVETAMATDSLSTLVTAVQAADLAETLQGDGPFTVFAPTNAAFDKLPEGTVDNLLLPENKEQLASLLQYHVVAGSVMSSDLTNGQVVTTLNGATLTVELADGMVYLIDGAGGRAMVQTADINTSNGIVHLIDSVVMPE